MNHASDATDLLTRTRTNTGETLADLSAKSPVLLVMLRHEGCIFCRNAMSDIARLRRQIEDAGTHIVLGHMITEKEFDAFSLRYGLSELKSVSDPDRALYKGLGLRRARWWQLLAPRVILAWIKAGKAGHKQGKINGDPFQLPGAFLLHDGQVIKSHLYRDAADRPDYVALGSL